MHNEVGLAASRRARCGPQQGCNGAGAAFAHQATEAAGNITVPHRCRQHLAVDAYILTHKILRGLVTATPAHMSRLGCGPQVTRSGTGVPEHPTRHHVQSGRLATTPAPLGTKQSRLQRQHGWWHAPTVTTTHTHARAGSGPCSAPGHRQRKHADSTHLTLQVFERGSWQARELASL